MRHALRTVADDNCPIFVTDIRKLPDGIYPAEYVGYLGYGEEFRFGCKSIFQAFNRVSAMLITFKIIQLCTGFVGKYLPWQKV